VFVAQMTAIRGDRRAKPKRYRVFGREAPFLFPVSFPEPIDPLIHLSRAAPDAVGPFSFLAAFVSKDS
jgi:hypothetical protein